jgi:DNA repair protein RadC
MPERIIQLGFDDNFQPVVPKDVTPRDFRGLVYQERPEITTPQQELARFVKEVKKGPKVTDTALAASYFMEKIYTPFEDFDQEEMWVLLMNNKNVITHEVMVYRGVVNSILVRPVEILKEAVRQNAPVLMVSHVHPSGDPEPSPEDIRITKKIVEAAKILELYLLDHLIIGKQRWVSLRQRGIGFDEK